MKQIISENYAVIYSEEVVTIDHPSTIFTDNEIEVVAVSSLELLNYEIAQRKPNTLTKLPEIGGWCERFVVYNYGDRSAICLQGHSRTHNKLEDIPNLFTIIEHIEGYPVWEQPDSTTAYKKDEIVHYPNKDSQLYISKINANTTKPDGDIPHNRYWVPYTD